MTDNVRYVDIKPGSHARLTLVTASRTIVSRRLDVVRAKARTSSNTTRATAASARTEAACLLGKLTAMKPGDSARQPRRLRALAVAWTRALGCEMTRA